MVGFVYGKSGCGKSEWMFSHMENTAKEGRVFLLVPDREAVAAESRASALAGAGNIDVITFGRLCNYVFRSYGGLCVDYIGKGAKKLIMRNVMHTLSPLLKEYGNSTGWGTLEKLTMARAEFYQDKIFPSDLDRASGTLGEDSSIASKVSDLSLIFAAFDAEIASRWEDPDGILSKANDLLATHDFFAGSTVYIDSFSSFSAQQYDIIEKMMKGAKDVFVTLPYLPEQKEQASNLHLVAMERRLCYIAERAGVDVVETIALRRAKRYQNEELAFLSSEIAGDGHVRASWDTAPKNIDVVRAVSAFSEAESAALDICRVIRMGARYREIAVIVRDVSLYDGILDAVFRKYDIPYFVSSRKEISEKSLVKLIYSAFAVCERGFRGEDVIAYIKSGFSGITSDEENLFENYIVKWNIRGKMFTGDDVWNMHPRGYGASFSQADRETLETLASIRRRVIEPLKKFAAVGKLASTVRDRATLLFDFLSELGVPLMLSESANDAMARGDRALAAENVQIWNVLLESLDQLVVCCSDAEVSVQEFSQMLLVILRETDIGKIPTSVDEVSIFSASQTTPGAYRFVYVLGANEGVFPQKVSEDGLFSEYEKKKLADCGIEITNRMERRVSEELFYFNRAVALPSERLYVSFSRYGESGATLRESVGVKRILALFPLLSVSDFEMTPPESLVERKSSSFEYAMTLPGNLGRALRDFYDADPIYAEKLQYIQTPLSAVGCRLSVQAANELFGSHLRTSYSRLETYIKCRFSYFCEYELKLRDTMPAYFGSPDIGSFMHGILENAVRWIAQDGNGDVHEMVRSVAEEYIRTTFLMSPTTMPKRLRHLFAYLCRTAEQFIYRFQEEFASSSFRPCDFELSIGRDDGGVLPMRLEGEGVEIELRGKIDRVDAYADGDGKLYLRVLDYKTGEKTFDVRNVKLGLDMQMLLYLFSLWENGAARYGKEVVPAGILYAGIKPMQIDLKIGDVAHGGENSVRTTGLLLQEEKILRAMEPSLEGKWIPVKESDLGKKKANLMGLDAFLNLKKEVSDTVLQYARELSQGVAYAKPLAVKGKMPCEYCKMAPVCRAKSANSQ